MRTRPTVLVAMACGLIVPGAALAPATADAAPHHNRGLTIAVTPNDIPSGEGVLIYGQLKGSDVAHRRIYLYHRLALAPRFTLIQSTSTNRYGFYEFTRADGVVTTNRSWFAVGPGDTHSRTVHERVRSAVTLSQPPASAGTRQPVTFTGAVSPAHRGQRVLLQQQTAISGNGWRTIATGYTDPASNFTIVHRFRVAGDYTLRAYFPSDPRNVAGSSDPVTLAVQQTQNPAFTIESSNPVIPDGQPVTISGVLAQGGTSPYASAVVTLYGRPAAGGSLKALASTATGTDGSYSFTQTPTANTVYKVETATKPKAVTAPLYQGVQDTVTMAAAPTSTQEGSVVSFSGAVSPDHTGHEIFLQRETASGRWQDVASSYLTAGSRYDLLYRFGQAGTFSLRARIYGGPRNVGGASAPQTITVSGAAAPNTLPPAS